MTEDIAFHRLQGTQHFRELGVARTCRRLDFLFDNSGQEIGLTQTFTYLTFINEIAVFWSHGQDDADDGILDVALSQCLIQQLEWITLLRIEP